MGDHNRSRPCPSLGWVRLDGEQIVCRTARVMLSPELVLVAVSLWVSCGAQPPSGRLWSCYVASGGI